MHVSVLESIILHEPLLNKPAFRTICQFCFMSRLGLSVKEEKAYRRKELNKHVQSRLTGIESAESIQIR